MRENEVQVGQRVRVARQLGSTIGFLIDPMLVAQRHPGARGEVLRPVAGHDGDVWWVRHENGEIAPYMFTELERA